MELMERDVDGAVNRAVLELFFLTNVEQKSATVRELTPFRQLNVTADNVRSHGACQVNGTLGHAKLGSVAQFRFFIFARAIWQDMTSRHPGLLRTWNGNTSLRF